MNQRNDLLSIGAFADMTRLSLKALRLYDQLNILPPRHVDPQSGYRYYDVDQLPGARLIRGMREMDMPLVTIGQVLAALGSSLAEAESLVNEYVQMREKQVEQVKQQVQHLIRLIRQEVEPVSLEVNIKTIAPQQVLSITRHTKVDKLGAVIRKSLQEMEAFLREQNASADGAAFGIYHGTINEQDDGPIEICLPVSGKVRPGGKAELRQLQGGNAACVTMLGAQCDFPAILGAYDAAADWIRKNGYKMAEPPREVWYEDQGDEARMEIVWLFR